MRVGVNDKEVIDVHRVSIETWRYLPSPQDLGTF